MKNFENLFTKVTEITDEFKQNLQYNEFEKSLTDLMNQYLAEHIQEVLETLMQDKWFISVLCSIAGKRCLSFEGYRFVSVSVLNDQRILVSTPYFCNRVRKKITFSYFRFGFKRENRTITTTYRFKKNSVNWHWQQH